MKCPRCHCSVLGNAHSCSIESEDRAEFWEIAAAGLPHTMIKASTPDEAACQAAEVYPEQVHSPLLVRRLQGGDWVEARFATLEITTGN
jgi:hypothetical protein